MQKIDMTYTEKTPGNFTFKIKVNDNSLIGKRGTFKIKRSVMVLDSRGNNEEKVIFKKFITINNESIEFKSKDVLYNYKDDDISIQYIALISIDYNMPVKIYLENEFMLKATSSHNHEKVMNPPDSYSFIDNLRALKGKDKMIVLFSLVISFLLVTLNSIIGFHDQAVSDSYVWIYSHYDSDGDGQIPIVSAMLVNSAFIGIVWAFIRNQLKKYMTFRFTGRRRLKIKKDTVIPIKELIRGVPRVNLENIQINVVAGNFAKGSYERGSGSSQRTVYFANPINSVVLFRQNIKNVPAHHLITNYLEGDVSFADIFSKLYPASIADEAGISLDWEVQLIHHDYIDQELVAPENSIVSEDFYIDVEKKVAS